MGEDRTHRYDLAHDIETLWRHCGLRGGFVARDLDSGAEIVLDADQEWPLASVAKLPLALVILDGFAAGTLDPAALVELRPAERCPGPTGISTFDYGCHVAAGDLVRLMLSVSDNAAADALFALRSPAAVTEQLQNWGCRGLVLRHPMRAIYDAFARLPDPQLALELTIRAGAEDGGHPLPELDVTRANSASARALVGLLDRIWSDSVGRPGVCATLRERLTHQAGRSRMHPDLVSDSVAYASKTGTFLNLRHEAGVVETEGRRIAVVALTGSDVPAFTQPEAEAAIGQAARWAVDSLLDRPISVPESC